MSDHCECGAERLHRDSAGRVKTIIPLRDKATRGDKLARVDWPPLHEWPGIVWCLLFEHHPRR